MKQQDFLDLIKASQTTIKQDLLPHYPESKYALLMLIRSFDLLREHIVQQESYQHKYQQALTDFFRMPILNIDEGIQTLCKEIREDQDLPVEQVLQTLRHLNQADLSISHPKVAQNA